MRFCVPGLRQTASPADVRPGNRGTRCRWCTGCSVKITELFFNPSAPASISLCVGNLFLFVCDVIAAAITVGLYLFPKSFCIIKTGLIPPCSEPTTGLKSAYELRKTKIDSLYNEAKIIKKLKV